MKTTLPLLTGAALAVIVPAWLLAVPVSAQQQAAAQERGEVRGGGGGGGARRDAAFGIGAERRIERVQRTGVRRQQQSAVGRRFERRRRVLVGPQRLRRFASRWRDRRQRRIRRAARRR